MKLVITGGILILAGMACATPVQAQGDNQAIIMAPPAPKPPENTPTLDYKPTTEFLETTNDTTELTSAATKCGIMIAKYNQLLRYIDRLEMVDKFLGSFSKVVSTTSLLVKLSTDDRDGLTSDAQDAVQDLIVTEGACYLLGKVFCPVYQAGMTFGTILNYAPKVLYGDMNEQTIKEVVSDYYAPIWGDFVNGKTVAQVEAGIAKMRDDARKARASAQRAQGTSLMCKKAEEAKNAVQDILAKAKADTAATRMTPIDSGLGAQTDAAINTGQADANAAAAAGNAQFISSMRATQQQAFQKQSATGPSSGWCPTPQPDGCGCGACGPGYSAASAPPVSAPTPTKPQSSEGCVLTEADIANGEVCVGN